VITSSAPDTVVMTPKEPVGVCEIITPCNFPATMITRIAPILAAECAVVKPPSETPCMAFSLAKLAIEAGFPRKVIQLVVRKDRGVASELEVNPLIRKVSFTESTGVGRALAKLAAGTAKKVSLVFGGNVPIAVLDDADLDLLLRGLCFPSSTAWDRLASAQIGFTCRVLLLRSFRGGLLRRLKSSSVDLTLTEYLPRAH
jgi:succinate-semialdehyde dehydrogenase/glutarate-semialdehyde dehydrogenase